MEKRKANLKIVLIGDAIVLAIVCGGAYVVCKAIGALFQLLGVG